MDLATFALNKLLEKKPEPKETKVEKVKKVVKKKVEAVKKIVKRKK